MDNFSKRLKKLRHELNITQNDFAQSCEVKLTAISKYETGLVKPGFDMLYKIASVYNVNLNWLILGIGEMFLQTVLYSSEYFKNVCREYDNVVLNCKRLIDWTRGIPYTYRKSDYDELMSSSAMFARKFSTKVDKEIIDMIYEKLRQ